MLVMSQSRLIFSAKRTDQDHHGIIDMTAFNTDGFDVTGRNVWIHDCNVWDQDDCIAVKVKSLFNVYIGSEMYVTLQASLLLLFTDCSLKIKTVSETYLCN